MINNSIHYTLLHVRSLQILKKAVLMSFLRHEKCVNNNYHYQNVNKHSERALMNVQYAYKRKENRKNVEFMV